MRSFAARWLTGDGRTLGLLAALGVLTSPFFQSDAWRDALGIAEEPGRALAPLLVVAAFAWRSLLRRGFVWLAPHVLTWQDFGEADRVGVVGTRLVIGWTGRLFALGYLTVLLGVLAVFPRQWAITAGALVLAGGLLALALARRAPRDTGAEAWGVLAFATAAVAVRPELWMLQATAVVLAVVAAGVFVRSGAAGRPQVAVLAGRAELVRGWQDRVARTVGVTFLDLAMLMPAARPVRRWSLARAGVVRFALVGVAGRARYLFSAALVALAVVSVRLAFPALPEIAVFAGLGYLAIVPFSGGLSDVWSSPGRRRWIGGTDRALRGGYVLVLGGLTVCWALSVLGTAALTGVHIQPVAVLPAVPVVAACAVRTATRPLPRYDDLGVTDTPLGMIPFRLVVQLVRGPDVGVLALLLLAHPLSWLLSSAVVAAVVLVCVLA